MSKKFLVAMFLALSSVGLSSKSWAAPAPCPSPSGSPIPTVTMENWSKILNAVGRYYGDRDGIFPRNLEALVTEKYLTSIPKCTTPWHGEQSGAVYPTSENQPLTNTGKWRYYNGSVGIDSKFVMTNNVVTNPYVLQQQLLGTLGTMRSMLSIYYAHQNGNYPSTLSLLANNIQYFPGALPMVSTCKKGVQSGETLFPSVPTSASQVKNTGKWGYVPTTGQVFIDSTEDNLYLK